jgi:2-succinyl-5-enolpyruvyl-6-hydroxy-3-cyclohexene-1-carboxylate synthase
VQLNARARKPLEPHVARDSSGEALRDEVDALIDVGPTRLVRPVSSPDPAAIARLADHCRLARRGLIVCGPSPALEVDPLAAAALAAATGFPILAEATSQLRFGRLAPAPEGPILGAVDPLLDALDVLGESPPDLVLQIGGPPASGTWSRYLETHRPERHVLARDGWPDPGSDAVSLLLGPVSAALFALAEAVAPAPAPAERASWRDRLAGLEGQAWRLAEEELAAAPGLSEPLAVRSAVDALPGGAALMLGNSLPLREVDAYCPPAPRELRVGYQRGANGIDGLVAGAAGMASVSGRPTAVLLGDLAFLHDAGGLWPARELDTPLAIVVLDNGGGRIFEQLPLARSGVSQEALRYWVTPHRLDLAALARLYGVPCAEPAGAAELGEAVGEAMDREGPSVVLARVEPHSAASSRERLRQRLAALLRGEAGA